MSTNFCFERLNTDCKINFRLEENLDQDQNLLFSWLRFEILVGNALFYDSVHLDKRKHI